MTSRRPAPGTVVAAPVVEELLDVAAVITRDRERAVRAVVVAVSRLRGDPARPETDERLLAEVLSGTVGGVRVWRLARADRRPARTADPRLGEAAIVVERALAGFSPRERASLALSWRCERPDEEIADLLSMHPARVEAIETRAVRAVRHEARISSAAPLITPAARGPAQGTAAPCSTQTARALLQQGMAAPRSWDGPDDLEARVADERTRRRRRRRQGALAGIVALAAFLVSLTTLLPRHQSPVLPPGGLGLLAWPARGELADDRALHQQVAGIWRRVEPSAPSRTYLLWAGRLDGGRLAILEGLDATGRPRLAQIDEGGDPATLVLAHSADLSPSANQAITIAYDGLVPREGDLGRALVRLLLAPDLAGDNAVEVLSRDLAPVGWDRLPWGRVGVRSDGLTEARLQADRPLPYSALWRIAAGATPSSGTVTTLGTRAGDLLPVAAPVQQRPDVGTGELASPQVVDDVLAALPPGAQVTVRALAVASPRTRGLWQGVRLSLVVTDGAGGRQLHLIARRGADVICHQVQRLTVDPSIRPVLGAACLLRGADPDVLVGLGWSSNPSARIFLSIPGEAPGSPRTVASQQHRIGISLGPGTAQLWHVVTSGAPPQGAVSWTVGGGDQTADQWVSAPVTPADD